MAYKFKTVRDNNIDVCTTTYSFIPGNFAAFVRQYFSEVLNKAVPDPKSVVLTNARTGAVIDSSKWPDIPEFASNTAIFVSVAVAKPVTAAATKAVVANTDTAIVAKIDTPAISDITAAEQNLEAAAAAIQTSVKN